jgi:hypothetical protein
MSGASMGPSRGASSNRDGPLIKELTTVETPPKSGSPRRAGRAAQAEEAAGQGTPFPQATIRGAYISLSVPGIRGCRGRLSTSLDRNRKMGDDATMQEINLDNWEAFDTYVRDLRQQHEHSRHSVVSPVLFRGHGDAAWTLATTLERSGPTLAPIRKSLLRASF